MPRLNQVQINMKNFIFILLSFLLVISLFSCVDEESTVGNKWVDSSFRNVITDTCTITLSTVLADSITTSGDSLCQLGHYRDEYRGSISGMFFAEYQVSSNAFSEEITYKFDSITVTFNPSGDYVGDTLNTRQHIYFHYLTENVELYDNSYLYNTSNIQYDPVPCASYTFTPRPNTKETFEARLPDELGERLLNLMKDNSIIFDTQDRFSQYFPGLAILPDENDNCISGFLVNDTSMCITMYYRKIEESATEQTCVFKPSSTLKYNKANQDRSNTPIEVLKTGTQDIVKSGESKQMAYLQGLVGLYTRLEFPFLNNLQTEGELVSIESAVLYLFPVQGTYNSFIPLPKSLSLYTTNNNDVTEGIITDSTGENIQTGSLVDDDAQNKNAYYSFDITSFIQSNLGTGGIDRQKLMLTLPDDKFLTTMGGLIIGDMNHPTNNIKLEVRYKVYNK